MIKTWIPGKMYLSAVWIVLVCLTVLSNSEELSFVSTFAATGVDNGLLVTNDYVGTDGIICELDAMDDDLYGRDIAPQMEFLFAVHGYKDMSLHCLGSLDFNVEESKNQYVGVAIAGEDLSNGTLGSDILVPLPLTGPLPYTILFENGTDVNITVQVLGNTDILEIPDALNGSVNNDFTISDTLFPTGGLYTVEMKLINPIGTTTVYMVFALQNPITNPGITLPQYPSGSTIIYVIVDTDVDFQFTADTGDDMMLTATIENDVEGLVDVIGDTCTGAGPYSRIITYLFPETKNYTIILEMSNYVNSHSETFTIIPYYKVNGFTLDVSDTIALSTTTVDFLIDIENTALFGMGLVTCDYDFGDDSGGDTQEIDCDVADFSSLVFTASPISHNYATANWYRTSVICHNLLPDVVGTEETFQKFENTVIIIYPVENLVISHNSPNISRHPFSQPLTITISLATVDNLPLHNLTCTHSYGEPSFSNITSDVNLEIDITFTTDGPNPVVVNCSNELSYQILTLPEDVNVYYDCWGEPVTFFGAGQKNVSAFLQVQTHLDIEVVAAVNLTGVCTAEKRTEWRLYTIVDEVEGTPTVEITDKPTVKKVLPALTMDAGTYKVEYCMSFLFESIATACDFVYLNYTHPLLQPRIKVNKLVTEIVTEASLGEEHQLDASESIDPAGILASVSSIPETFSWVCKTGAGLTRAIADDFMDTLILPPQADTDCPAGFLKYTNENHSKVVIEPFTMSKDQWYIVKMYYERGERKSFQAKAFFAVEGFQLSATIICLHNCMETEDRIKIKLTNMDLILNVTIYDQQVHKDTLYSWTLEMKMNKNDDYVNATGRLNTHRSGFSVNKTQLEILNGTAYRIACNIHIPGSRPWTVKKSFVFNEVPYGGTCYMKDYVAPLIAGETDWCFVCSGWKDEGLRADRDEVLDQNALLKYVAVQYFLDAGGQINTSIDPFKISPTNNGEKCSPLMLPPNGIKLALMKVFIYDTLNHHVEFNLGTVEIAGPVPEGVVGEDAAALIQEFALKQMARMQELKDIQDANTVAEMAATAAGALPEAPEQVRIAKDASSVAIEDKLTFDMKGDKPISEEELAEDLKQKEDLPETRVIEDATKNLTKTFKESLEIEAEKLSFSAGASQNFANAVASMSSSNKKNFNEASVDNLRRITDMVLAMYSNEASDPSRDSDTKTALLKMSKNVVNTVTPDDPIKPTDPKSLHDADELSELFASAETKDRREKSRAGREFLSLMEKKQTERKNIKTRKRLENTKKISQSVDTLGRKIADDTVLVDGTTASFGDDGAKVDVVQDQGEELSKRTMQGGDAAFNIPALESTKSSVKTSFLAMEKVTKLNEDGSDNGVTSKQYTMAISTNQELSNSKPTRVKMPVTMPPAEVITLETTAFLVNCKPGNDLIVVVGRDDLEVVIRCAGKDGTVTNKVYDSKKTPVGGKVQFGTDEITCIEEDPVCSWAIIDNTVEEDEEETTTSSRKRRSAIEQTLNVTVLSAACKTFDDSTNTWRTDECKGELNIETQEIDCYCTPKKELTVANSFYVPPNMIDFNSVFLKFSPLNQAAVMAILILTLIIYVIIIIWARRQDKKDLLKWGITPMSDNFSEDNYFYVIKVFTGMRPGAGTRSRVSMVIAGDEMDTGVRELADGVREEFATGSVMNFLMSATCYLGDLDYIRIWHDNSGSGNFASWYLSKIEVHDIQRNEMFMFLAERWLAVEQEDGLLECVLPVCKNENLNKFKNRFFLNAKDNLAESHIWVSVAYRPQASNFTRVQRASVALLFIMLTMIANAMFFKTEEEGSSEQPSELQVGPFRFSLKQVYISIICAVIVTPPTIVVIYLFKLAKHKLKPDEKLYKPRHRGNGYKVPFMSNWLEEEQKRSMELEQHLVTKGIPTNEGFRFPHAVVYIAWLLVISGSVLSAFFVMLYSMEWGKQKSEEWVTTFLLSFVESVFCLDPIKVGIMALVFALIFRSTQNSETPVDRGTIMKNYSTTLRGKSGGVRLPAPPLDSKKLEKARSVRQRELLMKTAFRDIIINVVMIWILFSISYSNRDTRSYDMLQEVHHQLLDPINLPSFTKIKSINEYFDWLRNTVIVNMFPETEIDGNKTELHWRVRQFIQGGVLFRVGPPRLRQLRTTKKRCKNPYFGEEDCFKKYTQTSEDAEDYCLGWKEGPCSEEEQLYKFSYDAWKFTSAFDTWGLPITGFYTTYGGGGYIAKLAVNREISNYILDELYNNSWVDRQTRSVLFEFTLYCLNANIFTYNMFMVEFPETGGAIPFYNIFPLTIYQHLGPMGMYTLICEVIFAVYQLVCTVCIIVMIVQQKKDFFKKPWQVYDFIFTILGYVAIVMYVIRFVFVNMSLDIFREDKREFVNFYHIAIWNQSFVLLIGVLVFMATLRMLNILGYNKRISALARVFTEAANELIWFGIFFLYVFTCYSAFGYLLFGSKLKSYMNVFKAMGTLFISMIGKSRFTEIDNTDPIMSKIYFVIFIFFVVYMILTMFLAILSKAIDQVHAESKKDKGDEMVDYVIKKVTGYLSYGSRSRKTSVNPVKAQYRTSSAKKRKFDVDTGAKMDHREILQEIRMTMNDAITTNPRDFTTPSEEKQEKKVKFRR